jgi:hypothetical protein
VANKILVARGTKARIEEIKSTLTVNELVYSTDTGELGVKKANGNIEYFMNAADIDASKQDKLVAGDNITIVGNTISASGYAVGVVETRASVLTKIWTGTQAQYDTIGTKDANTLYFII